MTAVKVALIGAAGRMGLEITRAAGGRSDVTIAAAVEHSSFGGLGRDLGDLAGVGAFGVRLVGDIDGALEAVDVAVDLSLPSATGEVLAAARRHRTPLVCGTTGVDAAILLAFDEAAADIPVLHAANLSPGIAMLAALVEHAARSLGEPYDIEIVEAHHRDKVDAPSGTALLLADAAARGRGLDEGAYIAGRSGHTGTRSRDEIGIHAVRGGGIFGDHTVVLSGRHERLELTHRAASRELFAEGALRAALFIHDKTPARYTMADVLDLAATTRAST
jgi:4-hydroxy-tetrahydrodipicolinate reductase